MLFICTNDRIFNELCAFARELVQYGKVVDMLIYINEKKLEPIYISRKGVSYYCRKDLKWTGRPKGEIIEKFINFKSDLLIVPVFEQAFHIKWIASLCDTKMIVAPFSGTNNWANILLKLENNNIEEFIKQTVHYLKMINNKQNTEL